MLFPDIVEVGVFCNFMCSCNLVIQQTLCPIWKLHPTRPSNKELTARVESVQIRPVQSKWASMTTPSIPAMA